MLVAGDAIDRTLGVTLVRPAFFGPFYAIFDPFLTAFWPSSTYFPAVFRPFSSIFVTFWPILAILSHFWLFSAHARLFCKKWLKKLLKMVENGWKWAKSDRIYWYLIMCYTGAHFLTNLFFSHFFLVYFDPFSPILTHFGHIMIQFGAFFDHFDPIRGLQQNAFFNIVYENQYSWWGSVLWIILLC